MNKVKLFLMILLTILQIGPDQYIVLTLKGKTPQLNTDIFFLILRYQFTFLLYISDKY